MTGPTRGANDRVHNGAEPSAVATPGPDFADRLTSEIRDAGGDGQVDPAWEGAVGSTMFDLPTSEDGTVTILVPQDKIDQAPSQALVRIMSRDEKRYLGVVSAGPFAEPDILRGDSGVIVTPSVRGAPYNPPYHGRVQVTLLGEELTDEIGQSVLSPPRLRPLPNSPAFVLDDDEAARILKSEGDIELGLASGYNDLRVTVPSKNKQVLPRHTAILGTTGGGKSTTVARLVQRAQAAGMAVVILDVEGEYTFLYEPTDDRRMLAGLASRGLEPAGVPAEMMALYHLVDRKTANPRHPHRHEFSLEFARLSPYTVAEILELTEAQQERFLRAYEIAKLIMRDLGIYPRRGNADEEQQAIGLDEFERGYPRMTLSLLIDVTEACLASVEKRSGFEPFNSFLGSDQGMNVLAGRVHAKELPASPISWRVLLSRLWRLQHLKVFDAPRREEREGAPISYPDLLRPGQVSVIDLSDSGMSVLTNIVIADLMRGIQQAQERAYQAAERQRERGGVAEPARVLLIVEEAHEFLSAERIDKMPNLFQQIASIAKRGRKRWLGLVFVTQLPQHLPRQVFGLVNSYVLHKITDPQVVSTLQRTVSGIDASLWQRLPGLAPGQAIVSFPHLTKPLLVSIHPTPARLRLID
ncbi:MAG TPA: ATP-binding protein [Dehalococcoidia bacterium]|nr:ATP-binding protein [Dehalococcoidia bacterium]